jgi:hypothetical protein
MRQIKIIEREFDAEDKIGAIMVLEEISVYG